MEYCIKIIFIYDMSTIQTYLEIMRYANFGNIITEILRKIRERRGT